MLFIAFRLLAIMSLITGLIYPYSITAISKQVFPFAAHGSVVSQDGQKVGSQWLAQKFESPRYFWPRPSAADYATVPSGASNAGPTSAALKAAIADRRAAWLKSHKNPNIPDELLLSSGSGLDPHLSPEAINYQAERVAQARGIPLERLRTLIDQSIIPPQWGVLGQARVNVFLLNLSLDQKGF